MRLHRKTLAVIALALALVGTSAGRSARAFGAAGGSGHGAVVQLATLEQRVRPWRHVRGGKVRGILWQTVRRARIGTARFRSRGGDVLARLPPADSWARGPPRALHS